MSITEPGVKGPMGIIPFEPRAQAIERDPWLVLGAEWLAGFISTATRATYSAAWKDFSEWFKGHPSQVTRAVVIAYRDHLAAKLKPATVGVRMAALASFYAQANAEGLIDR